jgi:hypothetical protein
MCVYVCMQFRKFKFKRPVLNKISKAITSLMVVTTELLRLELCVEKNEMI